MTQQDIDLQKIEVLEGYYQGWFNFKGSLVAGVIVATLILLATMQYERILPFYAGGIGYLIVIFFGLYSINDMKQNHNQHVSFINDLIEKIDKGERLDSLEKLLQKRKSDANREKPKSNAETKQPILTMTRDEGFIIVGVAIGFLVQILYDVSHEFTAYAFQRIPTETYWLITQGVLTGLFAVLAYVIIKKVPKK